MARAVGVSGQVSAPTGTARPEPAGSVAGLAVGAVVAVGALAYWLVVFRWHLVQGDDFTSAARAGHPRGAMSAAEWWQQYVHDYTQVNGRLADSVVRLVMIPGHWLWQLLGPVAFAVLAWQLFGWGQEGARWRRAFRRTPGEPPGPRWGDWPLPWWAAGLVAGAGAAALPLLVWRLPTVTGDALFWTSATVTYVAPAALVLTVVAACAALARGRPPGRARLVAVTAVILLAELMQEESALAVTFVVAVAFVTARARTGPFAPARTGPFAPARTGPFAPARTGPFARVPWPWAAATLIGLAIKLGAPGIRARVGTMSEVDSAPLGPVELLRRAANAVQVISWATAPALLAAGVLSLAVVAVLWRAPRRRDGEALAHGHGDGMLSHRDGRVAPSRRALALAGAGALLATAAVAGGWWLAAYRTDAGLHPLGLTALSAGPQRRIAVGVVALAAVELGGFTLVGLGLRRVWGPGPLLLLAATLGALAPPVVIGVLTPRGYVPAYLLLYAIPLLAAGTLLDLARAPVPGIPAGAGRTGAVLAAAVCLLAVVRAAPDAARIPDAMAANHRVWAGVERQMDDVRAGRCTRIGVPRGFPNPTYVFGNGFAQWYEPSMTLYFDLPAGTVWDRSGTTGCPS